MLKCCIGVGLQVATIVLYRAKSSSFDCFSSKKVDVTCIVAAVHDTSDIFPVQIAENVFGAWLWLEFVCVKTGSLTVLKHPHTPGSLASFSLIPVVWVRVKLLKRCCPQHLPFTSAITASSQFVQRRRTSLQLHAACLRSRCCPSFAGVGVSRWCYHSDTPHD